MLNRNDLAKQFEQVVQQEIKNHNDSISSTNLSINELRYKIKDQNYDLSIHKGKYESDKVDLKSTLDYFRNVHDNYVRKCDSRINDLEARINNHLLCVEKIRSEFESLKNVLSNHDHDISRFNEYTDNMSGFLEDIITKLSCDINDSRVKSQQELEKAKSEILSKPSDSIDVKKDLEMKMAIDRIDFAGLMKEIDKLKKKNFILEKHVEHLFTTLDASPKG